jgi:glycosyltransferase involved in cell wall biosynthesis
LSSTVKILLIDNSLDQTGASKALLQTIEAIPADKFEFTFIFPKNSKCVDIVRSKGYKVYELPFIEISKRVKDLIFYFPRLYTNARKIKKLLIQEGACIIHVNDLYNMTGILTKKFSGAKLVTHVRRMPESFPSSIYKIWAKMHLKYADHILAVSEANKNALPSNAKTSVMYDPLPEEEKLSKYSARPLLEKKLSVLYLANFNPEKGHRYALEILKRAVKEYPGWKFSFHFYGASFGLQKNDEYKQSLVQFAEENGLSSSIEFHGKTSEVEKVMKSHDLVLNLSDSESFSRLTLEALFYGVPVIATNVGGTNEMVIDGRTGLLAKPFDVDDMYAAFKKMISNDSLRVQMAEEGCRFVREEFSNERTVAKLIRVYESVNA